MRIRIISLLLLLGLTLSPELTMAQVSVRRGGSRTEASASKKEKKDKKADKADKPAKEAATTPAPNRGMSMMSDSPQPRAAQPKPAPAPRQDAAQQRNVPPAELPVSAPKRPAKKTGVKPSEVSTGVTLRQQAFSEYQKRDEGHVSWQHVVYRELDLTKEQNASLYFPTEPMDGLTNLFRVIFEGFISGRIKGYEYMDGRELFTDKYVVKVQDVLDKFGIYYKQNGQAFVVDEMDVPSNEVLRYYVKERWEFDQKTSKYGPRVLAICPILLRSGDFGGDAVPYPMFWVNYEDVRSLLREHLVMSEGMNNTPRYTMEEYFSLAQYDGEIYKVQNTRGLSLMQQFPDSASLDSARMSIEAQLRGFRDNIWVNEPTEEEVEAKKAEKRAERKAKNPEAATGDKKNRRTGEAVDMEAVEEEKEAKAEEIDQRIEETGTAHSARRSARRR